MTFPSNDLQIIKNIVQCFHQLVKINLPIFSIEEEINAKIFSSYGYKTFQEGEWNIDFVPFILKPESQTKIDACLPYTENNELLLIVGSKGCG